MGNSLGASPYIVCSNIFSLDYRNMNALCVATTNVLTINPDLFSSPELTYDIRSPAVTFSWDDSYVTSSDGLTDCGPYIWHVYKQDGVTVLDFPPYDTSVTN